MKKILAILLCLVFSLTFVACGDSDSNGAPWGAANNTNTNEGNAVLGNGIVQNDNVQNDVIQNDAIQNGIISNDINNVVQNDAQKFIDEQGDAFLAELESGFATTSGMGCVSTIVANGTGVVVTMKINGLNNITAAEKSQMQATYDANNATFAAALDSLQMEYPGISSLQINVCEEDGDYLAGIFAN